MLTSVRGTHTSTPVPHTPPPPRARPGKARGGAPPPPRPYHNAKHVGMEIPFNVEVGNLCIVFLFFFLLSFVPHPPPLAGKEGASAGGVDEEDFVKSYVDVPTIQVGLLSSS